MDDDTTCNVLDDYYGLLAEGLSAEEASKSILDNYYEEFGDEEGLEVMSLINVGLADAQLVKNHLIKRISSPRSNNNYFDSY